MGNYIEKANINYGEVDFEGSRIRTVEEDGQLHFCLSDCLNAVGTKSRTNDIQWDNERDTIKSYPLQTAGGKQLVKFVTESGMYELLEKVNLSNSDPEKSEKVLRFRYKLNNEILPDYRKHGYCVDTERIEDGNLALIQKIQSASRAELFRMMADVEEEKEKAQLENKRLAEEKGKIEEKNGILTDRCNEQAIVIRRQDSQILDMVNKLVAKRKPCPDGYRPTIVGAHQRNIKIKNYDPNQLPLFDDAKSNEKKKLAELLKEEKEEKHKKLLGK